MNHIHNEGIFQSGGYMAIGTAAVGRGAAVHADHGTTSPTSEACHKYAQQSAVRLCLAADVEKFSRLRTPEAARAQQRFIDVLARARSHANIDEAAVELQHSGDGQFAVLPPGLDESDVIPRLVEGLTIALLDINADLNDRVRIRIRVALHRGYLTRGDGGWIGDSAIAVHRILDSPELRRALIDRPEANFALIVPDVLYRDVIAHQHGNLRAEDFNQVVAKLPDKNFLEPAWIYLPLGDS